MRKSEKTPHLFFGSLCVYIYALENANLKHECKSVIKVFTTAL